MIRKINLGQTELKTSTLKTEGKLVQIDNESYYMIENFDQMQPFFMSIVSYSDHWMYLSSKGSLTAGRAQPEQAIFPYYTDDKIHDYAGITGSKTIILSTVNENTSLWEPFSDRYRGIYKTRRCIYKNEAGNKIIFEEYNLDLQLKFSYSWMNSERFGWVRKSTLANQSQSLAEINIVDGIQNILPYGVNRTMQGMLSTLVDAYKKTEKVEGTNLAIYRLSSIPVDKAEPSEALKATSVWSYGLNDIQLLLSSKQLDHFSNGSDIEAETENLGTKGAYLINASFQLEPNAQKIWYLVAEVSQDAAQIKASINFLKTCPNIASEIEHDVQKGTRNLISIVAKADGLQLTADTLNVKRHFANAMFNCMRGGVPFNDYQVHTSDFLQHVKHCNRNTFSKNNVWLNSLNSEIAYYELIELLTQKGDSDLIRLGLEYLPLMFSRRHGDPSRPWNLFNIKLKNDDGTPSQYYQGNWRDIFQNWEALAMTYPAFLPGMIAKFLNASTIDGYNAYKITRDGIEWEVLDPDDPWSNIGYWGDHQIIYLERLLELSAKFFPGNLEKWLSEKQFTYANVPYKIKAYNELIKNPNDSIVFDEEKHALCLQLEKEIGSDGKLLQLANETLKVNMLEKILVPLLSKLSNFVPGAGIWMNTQRPEWNDANNALVGIGASMVTLYYLRRYVAFVEKLLDNTTSNTFEIGAEVRELFMNISSALNNNIHILQTGLTDTNRKAVMDELGNAGSLFREKVYAGVSGKNHLVNKEGISTFLKIASSYIDHTIEQNHRPDGLYHAYNLLQIKSDKVGVRYLTAMLEGQVALLSSGYLNAVQALELLNKLRNSVLYRPDQRSYMLYPNKKLPSLLEKNNLMANEVNASALLKKLLSESNTSIVNIDIEGLYHFNGTFNNAQKLSEALDKLQIDLPNLAAEKQQVLELYEKLFDHESFTGRSGTFYKYEGLGCIYWHMVSKLLLAVGENIGMAEQSKADKTTIEGLKTHYKEIREGIGSHKSPAEYGAFPTDPYSHTPSMAGVQQPGMTGQVKEDLLSRLMELGVFVENGTIRFEPKKVDKREFITDVQIAKTSTFAQEFPMEFPRNKPFIAFSFCKVPVVYIKTGKPQILVKFKNNQFFIINGQRIDKIWGESIFKRERKIKQIDVQF
jgi:hypothetical protein